MKDNITGVALYSDLDKAWKFYCQHTDFDVLKVVDLVARRHVLAAAWLWMEVGSDGFNALTNNEPWLGEQVKFLSREAAAFELRDPFNGLETAQDTAEKASAALCMWHEDKYWIGTLKDVIRLSNEALRTAGAAECDTHKTIIRVLRDLRIKVSSYDEIETLSGWLK